MQEYQLIDKVLVYLVKCYKDSNNISNTSFKDVAANFTDIEESELITSINKLKSDGFLELMYYDSKTFTIYVNDSVIIQMDEDEFNSKGYYSYNEIADIIMPKKRRKRKK